jgi:hypothetical protein
MKCPTCGSTKPSMHPAVSGGGEVTKLCQDDFHGIYRSLRAYRPSNPTWSLTEEEFRQALKLPEGTSILSVHVDFTSHIITIVGSNS